MKRRVKHTKHFLEGWKNRSTEAEKDLLQCLRPRFLPNSRHTNNNIDFVRSELLSFKQMTSVEGIFSMHVKKGKSRFSGDKALACKSFTF